MVRVSGLPVQRPSRGTKTKKRKSWWNVGLPELMVVCCMFCLFATMFMMGRMTAIGSRIELAVQDGNALSSRKFMGPVLTNQDQVNNVVIDSQLMGSKNKSDDFATEAGLSNTMNNYENFTTETTALSNTSSTGHYCDGFSVSPPPVDKKRTGPRPCPVCYLPVEQAVALMPTSPTESPVLQNLTYYHEKNPYPTNSIGGSDFGGDPSLKLRNLSFSIQKSMIVHCGFVKGWRPGHGTGFDISYADLLEMEECRGIVVVSAIFDNIDIIQQPKNISEMSKKNVCFYMFVDKATEASLKKTTPINKEKKIGLWRVVVVQNLPYTDARRTGKIPKLLGHRLFPNARYSLWIDGKLELVVDPYQILERFLWRTNATFAISRHYTRFDVFEEAEANKAAGKYDNASIDHQVEFYKSEGLTPYSPAKLPITSDVPEGCVIIREHTPITNLFTCQWFNEVDRFTSRDQISFSTVRDKIMSNVNWTLEMFKDCERRNFVIQSYHRDYLEHKSSSTALSHPPPPPSPPKALVVKSPPSKPATVQSPQKKTPSPPSKPASAIQSPQKKTPSPPVTERPQEKKPPAKPSPEKKSSSKDRRDSKSSKHR